MHLLARGHKSGGGVNTEGEISRVEYWKSRLSPASLISF
jgi:hypothetical protein